MVKIISLKPSRFICHLFIRMEKLVLHFCVVELDDPKAAEKYSLYNTNLNEMSCQSQISVHMYYVLQEF